MWSDRGGANHREPDVSARRGGRCASGARVAADHRFDRSHAVTADMRLRPAVSAAPRRRRVVGVIVAEESQGNSATTAAAAERANDDLAYQNHILQGVSRTFALTIPQLPNPLCDVVGNAYLLCRIADTIEDEPALSVVQKQEFSERFVEIVGGREPAEGFARELRPLLSNAMPESEHDLVANTARVVRITHGFRPAQRDALERCVRIMSRGMAEFQRNATVGGLDDLGHLDRYCYHVAGVVGEMLTELFCDYSTEIGERRKELLSLSVSFGQGLQMTNILKDVWDDRRRGACWLPKDVFRSAGFDLHSLSVGRTDPAIRRGSAGTGRGRPSPPGRCVALHAAHSRSRDRDSSVLPVGAGMAVLTLRRIHAHPAYTASGEVKISRRSVRATVLVTNALARRDSALKLLFEAFTRGLSTPGKSGELHRSEPGSSRNGSRLRVEVLPPRRKYRRRATPVASGPALALRVKQEHFFEST